MAASQPSTKFLSESKNGLTAFENVGRRLSLHDALSILRRPAGKSLISVQPRLQKYSGSRFTQITFINFSVPAHRGAFRDRHGRWAGDAVDATALLTNGADADGEVVWS
jgi:hypothetical protein